MVSIRKVSLNHIALKNLKYQSFRTIILFLLLMITTITLFLGEILVRSMSEGIQKTSERIGADMIVVPNTFVSNVENALFLGKPCTVNFDRSWLDKIASVEGVEKVSSQLFLASLSSDCCDSQMQLIAFDMKTDFTVAPWLSKDKITSLKDNEIILGKNMKKSVGDTVKYFGRTFTVVDVFDETGMGYDGSAFISYEAAYKIANDPLYKNVLPFKSDDQVISMVLLNIKEGYDLSQVKDFIESKYDSEDIAVYSTNELLTKFTDSLKDINIYGNLIKWLFLVFAVTALYAIFSLTVHLRRHEFGSMISVGITKRKIIQILIYEISYIVLSASIVGILLVSGIIFLFHAELKSVFSIPYLLPGINTIVLISIKTICINVIVCMISSFHSFWKLNKLQAAELIREENG